MLLILSNLYETESGGREIYSVFVVVRLLFISFGLDTEEILVIFGFSYALEQYYSIWFAIMQRKAKMKLQTERETCFASL